MDEAALLSISYIGRWGLLFKLLHFDYTAIVVVDIFVQDIKNNYILFLHVVNKVHNIFSLISNSSLRRVCQI